MINDCCMVMAEARKLAEDRPLNNLSNLAGDWRLEIRRLALEISKSPYLFISIFSIVEVI